MKTIVIIQARMNSERLPGKVLLPLAGKPMLGRIVERIRTCKRIDDLIIATTKNPIDDIVVTVAKTSGCAVFRGDEYDVLSRYYYAATTMNANVVIRITADCPFIDPFIIDEMVKRFKKRNTGNNTCDYLSNIVKRTFPRGLDVEIFRYDILEKIFKVATDITHREHVTMYIHMNPKEFAIENYEANENMSSLRWTVDEKADYSMAVKVYDYLFPQNNNFRYNDILKLMQQHPEISVINALVKQKKTQ